MKTNYLFPHKLKWISGIVFTASFLLLAFMYASDGFEDKHWNMKVFAVVDGFLNDIQYFSWINNPVLDETLMLFIIVFGVMFAFTKEKQEDELVASIRLKSLALATIANYGILLLCYMFVYGMPFLNILMVAMFSQLIIFIILFRVKMYRFYNSRQDEE